MLISRWKKEIIDNSAAAFETSKKDDNVLERVLKYGATEIIDSDNLALRNEHQLVLLIQG